MNRRLANLFARINYESRAIVGPDEFKLNNLLELLERLGNPHLSVPVIHVAGTKGKGSVTHMLGHMLAASDFRTGVYTSPHFVTIRERIQIDGSWISERALEQTLEALEPHAHAIDACGVTPGDGSDVKPSVALAATGKTLTFFEMTTAAAFKYFADQDCDVVVLEVGLGGRLDSTNVCQPAATVITNISLDHTRQLGNTLGEIAAEKAGIVKPGVPLISGVRAPEAAQVIEAIAEQRGAPQIQLGSDFDIVVDTDSSKDEQEPFSVRGDFGSDRIRESPPMRLSLLGHHQRSNAALAWATLEKLSQRGWTIDWSAATRALQQLTIPGRMQVVAQQPTVVMDMAHNPASMGALVDTLQKEFLPWQQAARKHLLFSTSRDKDARSMLEILATHFDNIVLTEFQSNPRATPATELLELARPLALDATVHVVTPPTEALEQLGAGPQDLICITGSAFLVGELLTQFAAS